jgi:hypothetical protein
LHGLERLRVLLHPGITPTLLDFSAHENIHPTCCASRMMPDEGEDHEGQTREVLCRGVWEDGVVLETPEITGLH